MPCLAIFTPHAAVTIAAAVEMFSVPSPSPPVPQVSIASAGASTVKRPRAQGARRRRDLFDRFAAHVKRGQERRDLNLARACRP